MEAIFNIKNSIRDFFRKYDEYFTPIFRFVYCFIVFTSINKMFGYSELTNNSTVVMLVSILCALLSDDFTYFIAGVIMAFNCFTISLEVGAVFLILFIILYCAYIRFFPKTAFIVLLVPVCFQLNIPFLVPILAMILAGFGGAFSSACGVIIYYFSITAANISELLKAAADEADVEQLKILVDQIVKNKEMFLYAGAFIVTVILASIIYKLSFSFSWYVAIATAAIVEVFAFMVAGGRLGVEVNSSELMMGVFVGLLVALLIQVFKGVLDYRHKEIVQFEDDEYYYYVKAIPKIYSKKEKGNEEELLDDDEYDDEVDEEFLDYDVYNPVKEQLSKADKKAADKRAAERQAAREKAEASRTQQDVQGAVQGQMSRPVANQTPRPQQGVVAGMQQAQQPRPQQAQQPKPQQAQQPRMQQAQQPKPQQAQQPKMQQPQSTKPQKTENYGGLSVADLQNAAAGTDTQTAAKAAQEAQYQKDLEMLRYYQEQEKLKNQQK